ncbi:TetR/AcrR family transcriptional regulator [Pseudooceanicola sp. C21-150M6]|uniref:TetR/AcrR family transcriptional regulator n=1 Tax=Pseudooceanicola sp. C21-150M6 TaxID=3434355 RepID=UPI003D7F6D17
MDDAKTYHHGNLKPALIAAGLEILEERGLDGLSLRACADRVGVSHTAPKNHFGNVTGLLTAIAAEGQKQLLIAMQTAPDAPKSDRRLAAARGYVDFARAHPALFELMWSRRRVDFADPALAAPMSACAAVLRDISTGMVWDKDGEPDADLRAQMMNWCLVHGFAQLSLQGVFDKDGMRHLGIDDILPDFPFRD